MKKVNLKGIKINVFSLVKYMYPVTILLIVVILVILMNFLYHKVYQTIIQAELITDLRKEISEENLDKDKFNKALQAIERKRSDETIDIKTITDPFLPLPVIEPEIKTDQ
jgi:cell division protein FtsL